MISDIMKPAKLSDFTFVVKICASDVCDRCYLRILYNNKQIFTSDCINHGLVDLAKMTFEEGVSDFITNSTELDGLWRHLCLVERDQYTHGLFFNSLHKRYR